MEKTFSSLILFLRISLLIIVLALFPSILHSQCSCGSNPDVNPGAYSNSFSPTFNAEGFVSSYTYNFQFPCMGNPVPNLGQNEIYSYYLLYREKGTTDWTLKTSGGELSNGGLLFNDLKLNFGPFEPCKTYELRVTCPECEMGPFQVFCKPQEQVENFLNDPTEANNVSSIWEICYSPIRGQPIKNLKVASVDMANTTVTVKWDYLPGPATYTIYKQEPDFSWNVLGTTDQNEFQLDNLTFCASYNIKVEGSNDCCGLSKSQSASVRFIATDCLSTIESVDFITGNSAHVTWSVLGQNAVPISYNLTWRSNHSSGSTTTTATEHTITGLEPNVYYNVEVITDCGPQSCWGLSNTVLFQTNCELQEPNNSFQTATPIAISENHGNNNISPAGDIDFFKFTAAACDLIEIFVDHPDLSLATLHPDVWMGSELPYTLYDQNFQPVPRFSNYDYKDAQGRFHNSIHTVNPGQEYYLAVKGQSASWQNLKCYTVNVSPYVESDELINNSIEGPDQMLTVPSSHYYKLTGSGIHVQWSVTGPATLETVPELPCFAKLNFTGIGTVILTATIRSCNGTTAIFEKVIQVSSQACRLQGTYTSGNYSGNLSELQFNPLQNLNNYTITLNPLPAGTTISVVVLNGDASYVIQGNQIMVTQLSSIAKLKIVVNSGICDGLQGTFSFFKGEYPTGDDPLGWLISPNPTSGLIQVKPVLENGADPATIPQQVDIRLFNQYANQELFQQGSTSTPTNLNISSLMPGNYTLQLLYGAYFRQFIIVKQ